MKVLRAVSVSAFAALLGACASNSAVDKKISESQATTNQRIESVASQVEDLQTKQKQTDVKLDQLSQEAREARKRAQDAGVLAKGKVVFEQAFSEDRVKFGSDKYELDGSAQTALSDFATKVKALNEQYFVEIQGHTDDTGSSRYNEDLGQRRADAVQVEDLAPRLFEHRDLGPGPAGHVDHPLAEVALHAHHDRVARLQQVDRTGLHPRHARGTHWKGEGILREVRVSEELLGFQHDLQEGRVEVPQERGGHDGEDARMDVARARAEEQALGRVQLAGDAHEPVSMGGNFPDMLVIFAPG